MSIEKATRPGTTLRELGWTLSMPTVATAWGAWAWAIFSRQAIMRAAPAMASRRLGIGVVPA